MAERDYEEMYDKLNEYQLKEHAKNQRRIRNGIKCLWIIPLVFLLLMFITESSKLIFLVFWIVSLFLIATYLIYVEYSDYKIQEQMNEVLGKEDSIPDDLIDIEARRKRANEILSEIRANDLESLETLLGREHQEGEEE